MMKIYGTTIPTMIVKILNDPGYIVQVPVSVSAEGQCSDGGRAHTYPQQFFKFQTWQMTVIYYKVHYLPGGVRIRFHPNCRVGVFGDMANLSSEIG